LKINLRLVRDINILDCSGKITLGKGTTAVRNTIADILKGGGKRIVLNLADVNYIDSSGVGELVRTHTTLANRGGDLKLLCLTKKVQEVLVIMKLLTVFQVYESEQDIIASYSN